jgi:hypothetical protein
MGGNHSELIFLRFLFNYYFKANELQLRPPLGREMSSCPSCAKKLSWSCNVSDVYPLGPTSAQVFLKAGVVPLCQGARRATLETFQRKRKKYINRYIYQEKEVYIIFV